MEEGVAELRHFLLTEWRTDVPGVTMPPGCSKLVPYEGYQWTLGEYNRDAQLLNTIRVKASRHRVMECLMHLPGLEAIVAGVHRFMLSVLPLGVPTWLRLETFHILRQNASADCGSSFLVHTDENDDSRSQKRVFYLSVAVKLTEDPPNCNAASSMCVCTQNCTPVKYGAPAGSLLMFVSRQPHKSCPTPTSMGTVLKLVLFFGFEPSSPMARKFCQIVPPMYSYRSE